jgi:1,5-anhydro-D-fructose reductase (1,5-anhydro-D-mannitol-forming)
MSSVLRWGILGLGSIADRVAGAISATHTAELAGVCSRDFERAKDFAAKFRTTARATFAEMLEDPAIDAVYIATPNAFHADQTLLALSAGKHVLVEKPMALSVSDAQRMSLAAAAAERALAVGFHLRYHPVHRTMRQLVCDGNAGDVLFISGTFGSNWVNPPLDSWQMNPSLAGHGSITGLGVHLFDLLPWLVNRDITEVSAFSDRPTEGDRVDFFAQAMLAFQDGIHGHVLCSRRLPYAANDVVIHGTNMRLHAINTVGMDATGHLELTEGSTTEVIRPALEDLYRSEIEGFGSAVSGAGTFEADSAAGVRSVAVTEAVAQSARSRRAVAPGSERAF